MFGSTKINVSGSKFRLDTLIFVDSNVSYT